MKRRVRLRQKRTDSGKLYDGTVWQKILKSAGPVLSVQLNELQQAGVPVAELAILAGDGAVLSRLVRGWPAEVSLGAIVVRLEVLRAVAARLPLEQDMVEQLAAPPPAGNLHVLVVLQHRIDIVHQPVRLIDLRPIRAPLLDPAQVPDEDLVALATLEAARYGVSFSDADKAHMRKFLAEHKAELLAAGAALGLQARGAGGAA